MLTSKPRRLCLMIQVWLRCEAYMPKRKVNWAFIMGIPGAIGAAIALWILLGFPTLATSSDIQRLDRHQADTAVEVYQSKVRNTILNAPPAAATPQTHSLYKEELDQARGQLKRAEERKIELSK